MKKRQRSLLRAKKGGRDESRALVLLNGPVRRYEPVRNDYCPTHWRQLPCGRTHV